MKLTIELNQCVQDRNLQRIIEILLYFCFDLHGLDFDGSQCHTETFQFNHYFYRYAEENGFTLHTRLAGLSIHNLITGFLKDIENDYYETEMYHSFGFPRKEKYVQFSFSTWQHLYDLFSFVIEKEKVLDITPFGEVIMSDSLSGYINTFSEKDADGVLMCAKAVFSDIFKEHLHSVYPEMVFSKNGDPESSWRIPSLLDAMYLELFFRFSPNSSVRKCQNPDCPNYYTRTSSRPKKIYCSESCALLMAKRMERDRKRWLIVLSTAKPELMVLMYNSVKTVDIHRFTIIPVVTDAVPCAKRSQRKNGWINVGKMFLKLLTSMWCLLYLRN